jgi:hypothetical protein
VERLVDEMKMAEEGDGARRTRRQPHVAVLAIASGDICVGW